MAENGNVVDHYLDAEETRAGWEDVPCMRGLRVQEATFPLFKVSDSILLVSRSRIRWPKMLTDGQLKGVSEVELAGSQVCRMNSDTLLVLTATSC